MDPPALVPPPDMTVAFPIRTDQDLLKHIPMCVTALARLDTMSQNYSGLKTVFNVLHMDNWTYDGLRISWDTATNNTRDMSGAIQYSGHKAAVLTTNTTLYIDPTNMASLKVQALGTALDGMAVTLRFSQAQWKHQVITSHPREHVIHKGGRPVAIVIDGPVTSLAALLGHMWHAYATHAGAQLANSPSSPAYANIQYFPSSNNEHQHCRVDA